MLSETTIKRLEAKQEELALLFLEQSDIKVWQDLSDAQKRGDAYWHKKNCAQTLGIMVRIQSLLIMCLRKPAGSVTPEDDGLGERDQQMVADRAEREAVAVIERVRNRIKR